MKAILQAMITSINISDSAQPQCGDGCASPSRGSPNLGGGCASDFRSSNESAVVAGIEPAPEFIVPPDGEAQPSPHCDAA